MFGNAGWNELLEAQKFYWTDLLRLIKLLSTGAVTALEIFILTLIFSLPLGLLVAFGRMSKRKWIKKPIKIYILIMRGTPLLLQLWFVYYVPYFMMPKGMKINLDRFAFILIFVSFFYRVFTEIHWVHWGQFFFPLL
jgi:polar amino acid transport system permease protein